MSCFIVSNAHINALAHAILRYDVRTVWHEDQSKELYAPDVGFLLLAQSVRSYNRRYDKNVTAEFTWNPDAPEYSPVEILKACDCYDYQACETDDYDATLAHAIVEEIRHAAICALPGYEEAA
jgi:hypothetical protein